MKPGYDELLSKLRRSNIQSDNRNNKQEYNRRKKQGRNEKCNCGSGLKFKRCCGGVR